VPIFTPINPGTYWHEPFNVMPYMQYPSMLSAAEKGLTMGRMFAALPREAQENAAQSAMSAVAKEQTDALHQRIKDIRAGKAMQTVTDQNGNQMQVPMTPEQRSAAIGRELSAFQYGPAGGAFDYPGAQWRLYQMDPNFYQAGGSGVTTGGNPPPMNTGVDANPATHAQPGEHPTHQVPPPPHAVITPAQQAQSTTMTTGGANVMAAPVQ
jgi:hypothetical protein